MLYDETKNYYIRKKEIKSDFFSQNYLIGLKEYGEYKTIDLNIRTFNRLEFRGYILMLVLDGAGIARIDGRVISLTIGNLLIFNNDSSQVISNNGWKVCYIILEGENIRRILNKLFNGKNLYHFNEVYHFHDLYNKIFQSANTTKATPLIICSYILQLLAEIIKNDNSKTIQQSFETKALSYIENNYMRDISVEDMARHCGYSCSYFVREFKRVLKDTPHNYLILRRMSYAKQLLSLDDLTIEKISEKVGFNSVSNFCVVFKRKEKMTPREYQQITKKRM